MKILIVDDESLVRNGLKNTIAWESLGISNVLFAEDGQEALVVAREQEPEIILTDVRMSRMNGVELATQLRKILPNSSLIFMSGYSDKAYLKAAIHLKAVNYIEKPIDHEELKAAIAEAVRLRQENNSNLIAQSIRSRMEESHLAMALSQVTDIKRDEILKSWDALGLPPSNKLWFATVLVHFVNISDCSALPGFSSMMTSIHEMSSRKDIFFLHSTRVENKLILQLYSAAELTREHISWFCIQLQKIFANRVQFYIAAGLPVRGITRVSQSFQSAETMLQSSFYNDSGIILLWDTRQEPMAEIAFHDAITAFGEAIGNGNFLEAKNVEQAMFDKIMKRCQPPAELVKNVYYQFVSIMEWQATKNCINFSAMLDEQSPWQIIQRSTTIFELHQYIESLLESYIKMAREDRDENEWVFLMKDYIHKNYQRDGLSVREIAEEACLSIPYACTLFKNETGETINQFIANCRIDKAKQLLADPRCKITEVASQLGYSDSNYFGRSFKRLVGLSPSEYREKVLKWNL